MYEKAVGKYGKIFKTRRGYLDFFDFNLCQHLQWFTCALEIGRMVITMYMHERLL